MNTDIKDKIKMSIATGVLSIIVMIVFMIVIQYQVEGEKNMPYSLSKIAIISTAEGVQRTKKVSSIENLEDSNNTEDKEEIEGAEEPTEPTAPAKWDLTINQNNDIYFFIDKNEDVAKNELIESVTIQNVVVTKKPIKGEIKTYMPSSTEGRIFSCDDSYLVEEKLEYKGGANSNSKTLEIGNQGGSAVIRFCNTNIGDFVSDEDIEIKHDGTLISKVNATEEELKGQIDFDLVIQINKIKYKADITIDIPCKGLVEGGTTTTEITDMSNIIFKRIK